LYQIEKEKEKEKEKKKMESFEFPSLPVKGLGKSKGSPESIVIDTRNKYNMKFNGQTMETYGKLIYEKKFDSFVVLNENHKEPCYPKKINMFSSYKAYFQQIEENRPKESDYTVVFRYPSLQKVVDSEKLHKNNYFYSIPNINKISLAYYDMLLTMLGDYTYHVTNKKIIQKFQQDFAGTANEYTQLSKEQRGFLLLKYIIDNKYVECFLEYLENGYSLVNGQVVSISFNGETACYFKAQMLQEIVTEPLLLCTMCGFKFLVKPNGFVDSQSYKKLTSIYKYQSITTRYFGHYKPGFILTKHQKYMDHVGLYHAQLNYGPVLTFMHEAASPFDDLEKKYYLKLKSILLCGTENIYVEFKKLYEQNYSHFYARVQTEMKEYKAKIVNMKKEDNRLRNLQSISPDEKKKIKGIITELRGMLKCFNKFRRMFLEITGKFSNIDNIIWFLEFLEKKLKVGDSTAKHVFWKLLYKCKILKEAKTGDRIKRLGGSWVRKKGPKVKICFRKTIAIIVDKESTKIGSDKMFFDLQGINLDNIMNLKAHHIDCKVLQDNLYESQDATMINVCL
jgi:hypothetical protein